MSFTVIYYISIACPTVQKSLEMLDKYIQHGANNFQIDMPSKDPFGETDFVKAQMANALKDISDYDVYMNAFRSIREKHPGVKLSAVVYKDVIDSIGIKKFADFCKEIDIYSVRVAGQDKRSEYTEYLEASNIYIVEGIGYYLPEEHIQSVIGRNNIVVMRTRRSTQEPNPGYETWDARVGYVRDKGVTAPIFAIADMKTKEDLEAAKHGGADGTIVGNVLMNLWGDEEKLWIKFNELQSVAE